MNKKPIYWACGIAMALSLIFSLYTRSQYAAAQQTYEITLPMLLDVFAARPILYACLGLVSGLRLFGAIEKESLRRLSLIGGLLMVALFVGVAAASIAQVELNSFFNMIRQLFRSPIAFLIPGILVGLGLNDD